MHQLCEKCLIVTFMDVWSAKRIEEVHRTDRLCATYFKWSLVLCKKIDREPSCAILHKDLLPSGSGYGSRGPIESGSTALLESLVFAFGLYLS